MIYVNYNDFISSVWEIIFLDTYSFPIKILNYSGWQYFYQLFDDVKIKKKNSVLEWNSTGSIFLSCLIRLGLLSRCYFLIWQIVRYQRHVQHFAKLWQVLIEEQQKYWYLLSSDTRVKEMIYWANREDKHIAPQ